MSLNFNGRILEKKLNFFMKQLSRSNFKVKRGQDPEEIKKMPVFQFAPDSNATKKKAKIIYVCGFTLTGALGMPKLVKREQTDLRIVKRPIREVRIPKKLSFINPDTRVHDVACGYGFTVIAAECKDSSHKLFGCGLNTDSQIGCHFRPKTNQPLVSLLQPVPIQLPIDEKVKVVQVSCGRAHTICQTSDGQIFSFGNNSFGQCGRPIVDDEVYLSNRTIHKINEIEDKVSKIICGQDHSLFLTEKGEIYSCGWGSDGQTGLGHFNDVSTPTKIGGDIKGEKIIDVSSAVDCALAVNDKGDVFGWGNSEYSQFGNITNEKQLTVSRKLNMGQTGRIMKTAAGGTVCAVLNEKGQVYVWGYGILGKGPKVDHLNKPSLLPMQLFGLNQLNTDIRVIDIKASLNHFAAITNKGDLYTWGKNRDSCLGLGHPGDMFFPFKVNLPLSVRNVSLGIDHTAIICDL